MTQTDVDVMFGRLTKAQARTAVCRNPSDCSRAWHGSEDIIRRRFTADQQREIWAGTHCPQCANRFASDVEVVLAMLSPDALPDLASDVEGHQIGGRRR